ncbi:ATP-dependent endonuclease [Ruania zhangjianzhongii]|uniref:ATP-dependent endonuclease n=1 Tax=Ruania zhangjianzhongii TaxID=2603206 RepID=UPI0011CB1EB0|nr:ATP-dependent endonuclease [Ruania zhangjianzhongii]
MREPADVRAAVRGWAAGGRALDRAEIGGLHRAVLVEGISDVAALETLAARTGPPLQGRGVALIPMGGATNVRRYAELLGPSGLGLSLTGLCDAGEERFFRSVLPAEDVLVCRADLEEELIRALGGSGTIEVIAAEGDLSAWRLFQRQPAQRERGLTAQLRRFMGTLSGRKERYAAAMCAAMAEDRVPTPLAAVLASTDE